MKISTKFKPELIASKDTTRPVIAAAHLSEDKQWLEVTDSYRLARFPVTDTDKDDPGLIPMPVLVEARKAAKRADEFRVDCNGTVKAQGVNAFLEADRPEGTYPNLPAILEGCTTDQTLRVGLDAKMLYDLAKGLGSDRVELRFVRNGEDGINSLRPFTVHPLAAYAPGEERPEGLQMPFRLS